MILSQKKKQKALFCFAELAIAIVGASQGLSILDSFKERRSKPKFELNC
jgi:hypothetical protein